VSDPTERDLEEQLIRITSLLSSFDGRDVEADVEEIARCEVENEDPLQADLSEGGRK